MAQALLASTTANFVQKTLGAQLLSGATTMTLGNVTNIPNLPGVCVVDRINSSDVETPSSREVIKYAGTSGSTLIGLTRNADGSGSDQDHAINAIVEFVPDVLWADSVYDALTETVVASTGALDTTKVADLTTSQTLTNKTLTSPVLNTGVSGTAFLDEDDMASDSATKLASQQSIKAYVDTAITGIGASDTLIVGTANGAISSAQTLYMYPGGSIGDTNATETNRQTAVPAGTLKGIYFNVTANTLNNNCVVTVRDDAANTTIAVTVSTGSTGVKTNTGSVSVADLSKLSIKIDTSASGSGSITIHSPVIIYRVT